MALHTTKVFGQIKTINSGTSEIQALKAALADNPIPYDADLLETGVIRIDWNGPSVEGRISAFNDDFARAIDNIVRHPATTELNLYGQVMIVSNGFNDTLGITALTVREGRVYVENGDPVWSVPARRI